MPIDLIFIVNILDGAIAMSKYLDTTLFILGIFFISTSINAPNFLVGYGLVVAYAMIILAYIPTYRGVLIFFLAHLIAAGIMIYTEAAFTHVIILSLIVRTLILLCLIRLVDKGFLGNLGHRLLTLLALEVIIAYTIALLYYAHDAIEVGLDIYSLVYIPYIYLSHKYYSRGDKLSASILIFASVLYYFSAAYFIALMTFIISIVILLVYWTGIGLEKRYTPIFLIGLTLVAGVFSQPYIYYNIHVITYPFQPTSWMGTQWLQTESGSRCLQGNVFINTYDPSRLRILDTCVTVEGLVVTYPRKNMDGDITFDVELDPEYAHMLSIGSHILRRGRIHVEIVPGDQPNVYIPEKGERVRIVGVWVVDTDHGSWSEIHPAWYIERVG